MFYGAVDYEAKRLAVLEGYEVLDTEDEQQFDDLAALAANVCQTPMALIAFIDRHRQWFKARFGLDKHETPRAVAFCHYTIQAKAPLVVKDARQDPRFKNNPFVTHDPKVRFYAGVPLITPNGFAIGTICVIDLKPRELTDLQMKALEALGRQVFAQLELRRRLRSEERLKQDLEKRVAERTRELAKSVQEARSASRMKSAFLANMSHEIRTPLGAIMGFADLMKDSDLHDDEKKSYLDIITRNGELLQTLINDILDFSKIEAGHLQTERLRISPRALVNEVMASLSKSAREKGLWLKSQFTPNVPNAIESDPIRLKQILMNIVGNAVKFTQAGGVNVLVDYARDFERPEFRIEVQDTGIGLAPEQRERLFKTFSQADESITRKHGGTGLGLVLSKRLAELLGGNVVLKSSQVGVGSSFLITIKDRAYETLVQNQDADQKSKAQKGSDELKRPLDRGALKSVRVLVVDDSLDNQQLIERILQKYGASVERASNGMEGVAKASKGAHDVILMDLQMPVLDGYSATERLRACGYRKPIIALTAHALPENRERCASLGCTDHLTKPIQSKELVKAILKHVQTERALLKSESPQKA